MNMQKIGRAPEIVLEDVHANFQVFAVSSSIVLVGSAALVYAQDEKQEDKPAKQKKPSLSPNKKKRSQRVQRMRNPSKITRCRNRMRSAARNSRMSRLRLSGRNIRKCRRPGSARAGASGNAEWKSSTEQHAQNGRPAGGGGRIPDDKFRANFGHDHHFRASTVIVSGRPQFAYGGYNFQLVDVWPAGWAYTDDCYIDFIDGEYFLFD